MLCSPELSRIADISPGIMVQSKVTFLPWNCGVCFSSLALLAASQEGCNGPESSLFGGLEISELSSALPTTRPDLEFASYPLLLPNPPLLESSSSSRAPFLGSHPLSRDSIVGFCRCLALLPYFFSHSCCRALWPRRFFRGAASMSSSGSDSEPDQYPPFVSAGRNVEFANRLFLVWSVFTSASEDAVE